MTIFTIYSSVLSVYLLIDIILLIGALKQNIILLIVWVVFSIVWSGMIVVGIVIDGGANFGVNSTTFIKLTSLVLVVWSVFVVIGAVNDIKSGQKWTKMATIEGRKIKPTPKAPATVTTDADPPAYDDLIPKCGDTNIKENSH